MPLFRADQTADSVDFVLVFRPHSDLLAQMSTLSARPIHSTAGEQTFSMDEWDPWIEGLFSWITACPVTRSMVKNS